MFVLQNLVITSVVIGCMSQQIVPTLNQVVAGAINRFHSLDGDNDGIVTHAEHETTGTYSRDQFLRGTRGMYRRWMNCLFDLLDNDGDGMVDQTDNAAHFVAADTNRNDLLTEQEFDEFARVEYDGASDCYRNGDGAA